MFALGQQNSKTANGCIQHFRTYRSNGTCDNLFSCRSAFDASAMTPPETGGALMESSGPVALFPKVFADLHPGTISSAALATRSLLRLPNRTGFDQDGLSLPPPYRFVRGCQGWMNDRENNPPRVRRD
jgi:hypothetical protein